VQLSNSSRIEIVQFEDIVRVARGAFPLAILLYGHLGGVAAMTVEQSVLVYNLLVVTVLTIGVLATFQKWFVRLFVLTSFPVLFAFFRGNNEILTFGIFLCGMALIRRNPKTGVLVLLSGQLIEPHFSFVFWIWRLANREILLLTFVLSTTVLMIASIYVPGGSVAESINSIFEFVATQAQDGNLFRLTHNISLAAATDGYSYLFRGSSGVLDSVSWLPLVGMATATISSLIVLVVSRESKVEHVDLLIVILCLSLLLPLYSFTYRTIWLLYPLGLLLESSSEKVDLSTRRIQLILLMIIVVPKCWYFWSDPVSNVAFYEATLIDPTLTLALLIVTLSRMVSKNRTPSINQSPTIVSGGR